MCGGKVVMVCGDRMVVVCRGRVVVLCGGRVQWGGNAVRAVWLHEGEG